MMAKGVIPILAGVYTLTGHRLVLESLLNATTPGDFSLKRYHLNNLWLLK